jgi:hypothetical protein
VVVAPAGANPAAASRVTCLQTAKPHGRGVDERRVPDGSARARQPAPAGSKSSRPTLWPPVERKLALFPEESSSIGSPISSAGLMPGSRITGFGTSLLLIGRSANVQNAPFRRLACAGPVISSSQAGGGSGVLRSPSGDTAPRTAARATAPSKDRQNQEEKPLDAIAFGRRR